MEQNKTIRLFIGTYSDLEIFQDILDDIKKDFINVSFGKWVEPENLHFTYHFVGDLAVRRLAELKKCLSSTLGIYNASLKFKGLNVFPNIHKPKVLHVPVIHNGVLNEINTEMSEILTKHSINPGIKSFTPHITLQRIKDIDKSKFKKVIDKYRNYEFGMMQRFEVCLIESKLTAKGPVYTIH